MQRLWGSDLCKAEENCWEWNSEDSDQTTSRPVLGLNNLMMTTSSVMSVPAWGCLSSWVANLDSNLGCILVFATVLQGDKWQCFWDPTTGGVHFVSTMFCSVPEDYDLQLVCSFEHPTISVVLFIFRRLQPYSRRLQIWRRRLMRWRGQGMSLSDTYNCQKEVFVIFFFFFFKFLTYLLTLLLILWMLLLSVKKMITSRLDQTGRTQHKFLTHNRIQQA